MADREIREREVVRERGPGGDRSGVGMIVGVALALVLIVLIGLFALGAFGGAGDDSGPNIEVPEQIDVDADTDGGGGDSGE